MVIVFNGARVGGVFHPFVKLEVRSLLSMAGGNGFAQRLRMNLASALAEANQEHSLDQGIPLQKLLSFPQLIGNRFSRARPY